MIFFDFIRDNKLFTLIISIIINIILIVLLILFIPNNNVKDNNISISNTLDNTNENVNNYYVEVKGAVKKPGVYELSSNSIINDLINISGGFTKNAYTKNINLSKKITNELVVYIYSKDEYKKLKEDKIVYVTKEILKEVPCECSTYDISNCTNNGKSEIVSSDIDSVYQSNDTNNDNNSSLININTASLEELQTLPGIGLSKAKDIISYRITNGPFKDISDITNVSGIGNSIYEKIKDSITI